MEKRLTGDGEAVDAQQIVPQQITAGASESPLKKGGRSFDRDELEHFEDRVTSQQCCEIVAEDNEQSGDERRVLRYWEQVPDGRRFLYSAQLARGANPANDLTAVVEASLHGAAADFGAMAPLPQECRDWSDTY